VHISTVYSKTSTINNFMNKHKSDLEESRQLVEDLSWNERSVKQSARVLCSKAIWRGLDKEEVLELICSMPSTSYLRQHPHIFSETWESITQTTLPDQHLTEFERLLAGVN
jgi:hypothetical protein